MCETRLSPETPTLREGRGGGGRMEGTERKQKRQRGEKGMEIYTQKTVRAQLHDVVLPLKEIKPKSCMCTLDSLSNNCDI